MRKIFFSAAAMLLCGLVAAEADLPQTTPPADGRATATIRQLDLFKNGIGIITKSIQAPPVPSGIYRLDQVPESIDGTFYLLNADRVRLKMQEIVRSKELDLSKASYAQIFQGHDVTITLKNGEDEKQKIKGIVFNPQPGTQQNSGKLFLSSENQTIVLNESDIYSITGNGFSQEEQLPVATMFLEAESLPENLAMRYLAFGITWAPSYTITITGDKQMRLSQQAVLRNELEDFQDVQVRLITGWPNIVDGNKLSLLSPGQTLRNYLGMPVVAMPRGAFANDARLLGGKAYAMAMTDDSAADSAATSADMYFQDIGTLSMKKNESLYLPLAEKETEFRSIVEWTIPPQNDGNNTYPGNQNSNQQNDIWDSIVFVNPFDFPMTSASVNIYEQDKFSGQSAVDTIFPGKEATVKITKSLSIKTNITEQLDPTKREQVGTEPQRQSDQINVTISLENYRKLPAEIKIKKQFFGDFISAVEIPQNVQLLNTVFYSFNPLTQIEWTLTLQPGEKKELNFSYRTIRW